MTYYEFKKVAEFLQGLTPEMVYGETQQPKTKIASMSSKKDSNIDEDDMLAPLVKMGVLKIVH